MDYCLVGCSDFVSKDCCGHHLDSEVASFVDCCCPKGWREDCFEGSCFSRSGCFAQDLPGGLPDWLDPLFFHRSWDCRPGLLLDHLGPLPHHCRLRFRSKRYWYEVWLSVCRAGFRLHKPGCSNCPRSRRCIRSSHIRNSLCPTNLCSRDCSPNRSPSRNSSPRVNIQTRCIHTSH